MSRRRDIGAIGARLAAMEVNFRPETESRLQELAQRTGRAPDDLMEDAIAGYLKELGGTREMLDSRYDNLRDRRFTPIDGDIGFADLPRKSQQRR